MKQLTFAYNKALVNESIIQEVAQQLIPEIECIKNAHAKKYDSAYAALWAAQDEGLRNNVKSVAVSKLALQPAALVIIGIGGSNLGTRAVDEALFGSGILRNNVLPVYYADTVDPDLIGPMLCAIEELLKNKKSVLINVISKSGTTTETIANFELFLQLLKKYRPNDYQKYVVVATDLNSPLWQFADEQGFASLAIPKSFGGRFSVLSAVGLFPLAMLGVSVDDIHAGASAATEHCLQVSDSNYAVISSAIIFALYKKGYFIHNFFPFSVDLYGLGLWYRQLMAESLGKEYDRAGKCIQTGITPTVSVGSTDLHSIVELHLGGPNNTLTTFVEVENVQNKVFLPDDKRFDKIVAHLQGKSLSSLMNAMLTGTERAYSVQKRPFMHIAFPEKSAWYLGWFMQWKMIETIFLGNLFGINPFVQPNVELYKKETRAILSNE